MANVLFVLWQVYYGSQNKPLGRDLDLVQGDISSLGCLMFSGSQLFQRIRSKLLWPNWLLALVIFANSMMTKIVKNLPATQEKRFNPWVGK